MKVSVVTAGAIWKQIYERVLNRNGVVSMMEGFKHWGFLNFRLDASLDQNLQNRRF